MEGALAFRIFGKVEENGLTGKRSWSDAQASASRGKRITPIGPLRKKWAAIVKLAITRERNEKGRIRKK